LVFEGVVYECCLELVDVGVGVGYYEVFVVGFID